MKPLQPIRLLVTSGGTQEPIDNVRFLANRSSGALATLIAFEAAIHGYEVTLLCGNSSHVPGSHPRLQSIPFSSTRDLNAKLQELWPSNTILIMAAAVADFTPRGGQIHGKLSRNAPLSIEFSSTEDIVASLANQARDDQRVLAFALEERDQLEDNAKAKLFRKNVTAIVANPLETMDGDTIEAQVFCKNETCISPDGILSKPEFAKWLIENLDTILSTTTCDV